MLALYLFEAA